MHPSATLSPPVAERDHSQGPPSARVTLVEFGDYQCPYCGAAYPVVKRLQGSFDGELRFIFRNFPLTEAHPFAMIAAEAAEAAALQGKFWEMHDLLFENQAQLGPDAITGWARELGLDLEKFGTAIRQGEVSRRIKEDRRSGITSGVNGTPCFFINGARFDGPGSFDALRDALKK